MVFTEEEKKLIPEGGALGSTAKEDIRVPDLTQEQWDVIRARSDEIDRDRMIDPDEWKTYYTLHDWK